MSKLEEVRRENGRKLIQTHGGTKLATLLGHKSPSTLSQIFGPNPTRTPTEKLMRRMEEALGLPTGSTDGDMTPPPAVTTDTVAAVIRLVGVVLESEALSLPPRRFADVVALAYTDTMEHGGKPRETHIRSVVRLLK